MYEKCHALGKTYLIIVKWSVRGRYSRLRKFRHFSSYVNSCLFYLWIKSGVQKKVSSVHLLFSTNY